MKKINTILHEEEYLGQPVSSSRRLLNLLIDLALWSSLLFAVDMVYDLTQLSSGRILNFGFISATFLTYYFFMEASCQRTVGKFITKTRVVNKEGQKPTLIQIFLRTISRMIPLDQFSFIFVRRGFHDYLSDTMVIGELNKS